MEEKIVENKKEGSSFSWSLSLSYLLHLSYTSIASRHYVFLEANVFIGQKSKYLIKFQKDEVFWICRKIRPFPGFLPHVLCLRGERGGVLYIDTEGTFRPERIVQIAQASSRIKTWCALLYARATIILSKTFSVYIMIS